MIPDRTELLAAACHQAWYAYVVIGLGEPGLPWQTAPEWQKSATCHSIRFWDELDIEATPFDKLCAASHVAWVSHKLRDGWKYGSVKDAAKKEHPCLVSYEELPEYERKKDEAVLRTYRALRTVWPPES